MSPIHGQTTPQAGRRARCSTLLLNFHPDPGSSRASAALAAAARRRPGVSVREISTLYPAGQVDPEAEAAELLAADRLVMLFPVHWYAPPATFKTWADSVLTRMYYGAYETEGRLMEGKSLLVAATVGTAPEAYGPGGSSLYPLVDLLRPLEALAHRCGLRWETPFLLYSAGRLGRPELSAAGQAFADRLRVWDFEGDGCREAAAERGPRGRSFPDPVKRPARRPDLRPSRA